MYSVLDKETQTQEAERHAQDMSKYRAILYGDAPVEESVSKKRPETERVTAPRENAPSQKAIDDARALLFEGVRTYGEPVKASATAYAPVAEPVAAPVMAPVAAPYGADVQEESEEEDAMPTPKTMETVNRSQTVTEPQQASKTGFFASLSPKTKTVLIAIAVAIVLAIAIICINTSVIRSIGVNIDALRTRLAEETQTYEELAQEIENIENFEGEWGELVEEYARAHGMVMD